MGRPNVFVVAIVPFPFSDRTAVKGRPAVVVSSFEFNEAHECRILAMVTSTKARRRSDVALKDWRQAGLNVACWVRFKLFTLDDALILRSVGTLSNRDCEAVKRALGRWLDVR